ncbi:MAG: 4Fe-4S dicluster domain-containing protein [Desulfuromonadales bacterium]|nr:4Fe-4S dicluster domain-containing protein [Desulfuromonadales bacterium]MBN2792497.1 4Fe-4S dicluster domain-containing protein [Desulfuromonadales bacterium]
MLKTLTAQDLFRLLDRVSRDYNLLVPRNLDDGTRGLVKWDGQQLDFCGDPLQRKPTSHFFPQTDLLVQLLKDGTASVPRKTPEPLALLGLCREDLQGIAFCDRFFSVPPADDIYLDKRRGALLIGLTGQAGPEGEFLPLAGQDCDIELIAEKPTWTAVAYSEPGAHLLEEFPDADPQGFERLWERSAEITVARQEKLAQAAQLLQRELVTDDFWEEIAARCIRCGGCNFVCPTCTCFCVQDRQGSHGTERSRIWDSCQLDAFMREAGGHNPLGTALLRTRRRIHHKLVDDPQRWGEPGCVLCGRCDRACPTGIGMYSVCDAIVSRFGERL